MCTGGALFFTCSRLHVLWLCVRVYTSKGTCGGAFLSFLCCFFFFFFFYPPLPPPFLGLPVVVVVVFSVIVALVIFAVIFRALSLPVWFSRFFFFACLLSFRGASVEKMRGCVGRWRRAYSLVPVCVCSLSVVASASCCAFLSASLYLMYVPFFFFFHVGVSRWVCMP